MTLQSQCLAVALVFVTAVPVSLDAARKGAAASVEVTGTDILVLWSEPSDLASRDLFNGPGGKNHAPGSGPFTFIREDAGGTNPKFIVIDAQGVRWVAKLGPEARAETAATRLVWAAGFFADEDYFVPTLHVRGLPAHLRRGGEFVSTGGTVSNVRLERWRAKPAGRWRWRDSPFAGTRELNGLRVMMALINNWDLKDSNNAVYIVDDPGNRSLRKRVYVVSDLGSSFGTEGLSLPRSRSKGNIASYTHSRFVRKVASGYVDFGVPETPNLIYLFTPQEFFPRLRQRWIGRHIPRSDVKWIGGILARLSDKQIRDAFRAAGYSPGEVNGFTETVRNRIAALEDL
jgi:hypothetical protein